MARIVQLTDNTLLGFARDTRIRGAIPLFERLYRSVGKQGGCRCRKRHGTTGAILAGVKSSIARDSGLASRLKKLIGATLLVVHVREGKAIVRKEV
jgi:hypothetical protein